MTWGELKARWANSPDNMELLVWDMGAGGIVPMNSTERDEKLDGTPTGILQYDRELQS